MGEILEKLRPDRDLQCYFERPSAVAAMSGACATGFTVSGSWRQQFDWAVIEWNRDNVLDHPLLRTLPDGNLSGLRLSYEEARTNCMPMDSELYPTVEWPYLRVWTEDGGFYKVPLREHATPASGEYQPAAAEFELTALPTAWEYIGLAWMSEHATYRILPTDTIETALDAVAASVNASETMRATRTEQRIRLTSMSRGANGNRIGVYGYVTGGGAAAWSPGCQLMSGGTSPDRWLVDLDFGNLHDVEGVPVPTDRVRKMRWTYAADYQRDAFERCDFLVQVANWTVSGSGRQYSVAGAGTRRIEDDSPDVEYSGQWTDGRGNYSGGSIRYTAVPGSAVHCTYRASAAHRLYVGTRFAANAGSIEIAVDGNTPLQRGLLIPDEDVLARVPAGDLGPGEHSVQITNTGPAGSYFYFDFLEVAIPEAELPSVPADDVFALATDWDTDHSISVPPERTAWMIHTLGFHGRVNHYAGALWFYELTRVGHAYASATVAFSGTPEFSALTTITIDQTPISHRNLIGDTAEKIAKAFELEINRGYMAIRAEAQGRVLTLLARAMGSAGNAIAIAAEPTVGDFTALASGPYLAGGEDGAWRTDLARVPRLNRAARDWTRSYLAALRGYGLNVAVAFSLELQHGDPGLEAGIAQRYPNGVPVLLNTPALQTNFSPVSIAFWQQVYREMAALMQESGADPFLQFGEVQWWYFPLADSGMPFYDAYTRDSFRAVYGHEMRVVQGNDVAPSDFPEESAFLPTLIGSFTSAVMAFVRQVVPACKFEVLYPPDVNETPFNRTVNYPHAHWTPETLNCIKTENFSYTGGRDLDKARESIALTESFGFPPEQRAHLVGIGDHTAAWKKEAMLARAQGLASVVLFALDQFCLIGYPVPVKVQARRARFLG